MNILESQSSINEYSKRVVTPDKAITKLLAVAIVAGGFLWLFPQGVAAGTLGAAGSELVSTLYNRYKREKVKKEFITGSRV